jgi:hypothetical protein
MCVYMKQYEHVTHVHLHVNIICESRSVEPCVNVFNFVAPGVWTRQIT